MKRRPKGPSVPPERQETLRQEMVSLLRGSELSAKDISANIGVSEKEVYYHLEHIQLTLGKKKGALEVIPAQCRKCGFVFKKRQRLKKPGRCPSCRAESITEPLFTVRRY